MTGYKQPQAPGLGMRSGLFLKLMGAFSLVLLAMALLATLLARRATETEFTLYTSTLGRRQAELLAPLLGDYYRSNGSWAGVDAVFADTTGTRGQQGMMGPGMMRPGSPMMRGTNMWQMMGLRALVVDNLGRVVADSAGDSANSLEGVRLTSAELAAGVPITVGDNWVGTALVTTLEESGGQDQRFLQEVNRAIILGVLGAGILALLVAALFTWRLTRPLRELTAAAEAITAGELEQQVAVRSGDEVGELAVAFNQMAARLARAETLRRRLTADIAHELRTPLTVIQGNVEALQDGVFPLNPEALAPIHAKTTLLIRLVEDLRQLALAENDALPLERTSLDLLPVVREVVAEFQAEAREVEVGLTFSPPRELPAVIADRQRLVQVLANLLGNALRHTPHGGEITIEVGRPGRMEVVPVADDTECLAVAVRDSGPGIPPEDLANVFERFYRADRGRARNADGSGSGLGLAIARSLVEAHGGRLRVDNAAEGGAVFWFTLPLAQTPRAAPPDGAYISGG